MNWKDRPQFRWSSDELAAKLAAVRHHQGRLHRRMEGLGFCCAPKRSYPRLQKRSSNPARSKARNLDRDQVRFSIARRFGMRSAARAYRSKRRGVVDMPDATQKFDLALTEERGCSTACRTIPDRARSHEQDRRRPLQATRTPDASHVGLCRQRAGALSSPRSCSGGRDARLPRMVQWREQTRPSDRGRRRLPSIGSRSNFRGRCAMAVSPGAIASLRRWLPVRTDLGVSTAC